MMFEPRLHCCAGTFSVLRCPACCVRASNDGSDRSRGFSLTELLVSVAVVLMLMALVATAVSTAKSSQRHLATKALISKLDGIIAAQYASYGSLNVAAPTASARDEQLLTIARGDLPDDWSDVDGLAGMDPTSLTPAQRAYAAIWNAVENQSRVTQNHSSAECLFMIVMQSGIADCLDCRGLRSEIGDVDGDEMPEFIDAWGMPIEFVFSPAGEDSETPPKPAYGSTRPLIVSAGPDREYGVYRVHPTAGPVDTSFAHADDITNLDEEAAR